MDIVNPTNTKIKIDSVFAGLFINDKKVGSIEKNEAFTIEKKARTPVELPVKIIGLGLGQALAAFIKDPKKAITIKVLGTVRTLGIDTALNEEIPLTV